MKRLLTFLAVGLLAVSPSPVDTAEAAIVKTTITIATPSYIYASVANPLDVQVCSKASLSATICEGVVDRKVTLYADNVKVATVTTVAGIASFNWTPKKSGKISLKASVATASSSLRAANSEIKKVTVKPKTKATTIRVMSCADSCREGLPANVDLNGDGVMFAGISSGVTKGRKIRIQTIRVTNKFVDQSSTSATWQSDIDAYGMVVSHYAMDPDGECTPGSTARWNFRFYVDATSKSPGAATKSKWINLTCPDSGAVEDIAMDFTYSDQTIDSSIESVPSADIYVTAPDSSQYSIWTEYCSKDSECWVSDNWNSIEGFFQGDLIYGSRDFNLSMDPGFTGDFLVRVKIIPWTDQDIFYSESYSLTIN